MRKELRTEIEIAAPPARVWQILVDFEAYPSWNPFMTEISGSPAVGERLSVHLKPAGGRGMTMHPTVLEADPERRFRWLGRLFVPRLFDGEHILSVEALGPDRTRFTQHEKFRGLLVRPLAGWLDKGTLQGFELMNQALKERAELVRA